MSFTHYVSGRFLRSRGSRFLSLISIFAGLGIVLGVMVLDVTLAVMNGFRDQIQMKFVENMPMVSVMDRRGFDDLETTIQELRDDPEVMGAAPFIRSEAAITHERVPGNEITRGGVVWGIDPQNQGDVTSFEENVRPGFSSFRTVGQIGGGEDVPGVVLGAELAGGMRALVGDIIAIHAPRKTAMGNYESTTQEFLVIGIFESGMYEFDLSFAYIDIEVARELFERPGGADGIGVRLTDMMRAPQFAERIEQELGYPRFYANDWISLNSQLFEWIQMEKALMFLLLLFLVLIASFNVVAILTMMVRDRARDIGILMSLGASNRKLTRIFVRLGMVIGVVGTVVGSGAGLMVVILLDQLGFPLPGDVLFVDTLPVHAKVGDFALVASATLFLTFLATLLPAWLATRYTPVEVLRHE
jgi:lipoprotein-releasing system permease protein